MSDLTASRVADAIAAVNLAEIGTSPAHRLAEYGNLLIRWSSRTNLTAIKDTEGVLHRHLVECVAAAQVLPAGIRTLLDYGSGAGLPGIPIALCRPEIGVTLAESQSKKVAFLREAIRALELPVEVFPGRVSEMGSTERFDSAALRAVDKMEAAIPEAWSRIKGNGWLAVFTTERSSAKVLLAVGMQPEIRHPLPTYGDLSLFRRPVPN